MQAAIRRLVTLSKVIIGLGIAATAAPAAEARYRLINLQSGAPPEVRSSLARAINGHGDVAGAYWLPGDIFGRPFVYTDASGFTPLDGTGTFEGEPAAINNCGQVAIYGGYAPSGPDSPTAWRYTPGRGFEALGTLGIPGDIGDVPNGMNNLGEVVGRSDTVREGRPWQEAFLYTDKLGMVNLGSLRPGAFATATDINDSGQITGHSGGCAFVYTADSGMVAIGRGAGFAINNLGVVVGEVDSGEAAMFKDGTTRLLGNLGGETLANDVNDYNVVVGEVLVGRTSSGFIWTETEGMLDLQTLIEPGWDLIGAWAINNNGQIAAYANHPGIGTVAVRLDPIAPKLTVRRLTTGVALVGWSPAWPGIVLEATDDLAAARWEPVPTAGTNVVVVPVEGRQRFFRLNLEGIRGLCCPPE